MVWATSVGVAAGGKGGYLGYLGLFSLSIALLINEAVSVFRAYILASSVSDV